jgi:single-strand DNA-binding protein|tara:strand:- start:1606 stop:2025 length:420 start_codon:yes stop_codon:yes gene_type:complete
MLPQIYGEFGVVADPELRFSEGGSSWIKIRGVSKDRVRDKQGVWSDGDPLFIDIVGSGQSSERLYESINKGDTIMVSGKLKQREYEKDGEKRVVQEIRADNLAVSVRWTTAKTPRASEQTVKVSEIADSFNAEIVEPPF